MLRKIAAPRPCTDPGDRALPKRSQALNRCAISSRFSIAIRIVRMRTRALGSSGLQVSEVGLGCNNFGGRIDEGATREVVAAALDAGIDFFDTADSYGN
jgi:hypothetical protein